MLSSKYQEFAAAPYSFFSLEDSLMVADDCQHYLIVMMREHACIIAAGLLQSPHWLPRPSANQATAQIKAKPRKFLHRCKMQMHIKYTKTKNKTELTQVFQNT
jgi:hypothetical protein